MSNIWNEPSDGLQGSSENPWTQGAGGPNYNEREPATASVAQKQAGGLGVIIAIIGVLLVAIAGVAAYLFLVPSGGGNSSVGTSSDDFMVSTVTETALAEEEISFESTETIPAEIEDDALSTTTRDARPVAAAEHNGDQAPENEIVLPAPARSAGLNLSGWSDNAVTRCRSGEELIYAGKGTNAWVTVCRSGFEMTYRSDVFGGTLTSAVDLGQSNPAQGNFVIPVAPSTIRLSGDVVRVYQDGVEIATESLPNAWVLY